MPTIIYQYVNTFALERFIVPVFFLLAALTCCIIWLYRERVRLSTQQRQRDKHYQETLQKLQKQLSEIKAQQEQHQIELEANSVSAQAQTAFLGVIGHELRNPVISILSGLELLEDTALSNSQRKHLHQLRTSASILSGSLNDMLSFAQHSSHEPTIEKTTFNLQQLIDDVLTVHSFTAEHKSLALLVDIAPSVPPFLQGDKEKIIRILDNVIGNAIKFSESGSVLITVQGANRHPLLIEFLIHDNGAGMDADELSIVMQPFVQGKQGIAQRTGTGLGLPVCQRLIDLLGGTLTLRSDPGEGTTVSCVIPLKIGQPPAMHTEKAGSAVRIPHHPCLQVLIIEDDAATRLVLYRYLQSLGHECYQAPNAHEAFAMLPNIHIDLAVLDIHLPDASGIDVALRLRTTERYAALPVLFNSAHQTDVLDQKIEQISNTLFLAKPLTRDALAHAIDHLIAPPTPASKALPLSLPGTGCIQHQSFLDQERLILGDAAVSEILQIYLQQGAGLRQHLLEQTECLNAAACGRVLHTLKGAASAVGLYGLADTFGKYERQCMNVELDWPDRIEAAIRLQQQAEAQITEALLRFDVASDSKTIPLAAHRRNHG